MADIKNVDTITSESVATHLSPENFDNTNEFHKQLHANGLSVHLSFTRQDYYEYYKTKLLSPGDTFNMFNNMTRRDIEKMVFKAREYLDYLTIVEKFDYVYDTYHSEPKK